MRRTPGKLQPRWQALLLALTVAATGAVAVVVAPSAVDLAVTSRTLPDSRDFTL